MGGRDGERRSWGCRRRIAGLGPWALGFPLRPFSLSLVFEAPPERIEDGRKIGAGDPNKGARISPIFQLLPYLSTVFYA